jgi:hypothetical protein
MSNRHFAPRPVPHRPEAKMAAGHRQRCPWRLRLDASRRLPILGRLPIMGRVPGCVPGPRGPQHCPAKHQPSHHRRGEPGGQADQHPPPRAHPHTPKGYVPTRKPAAVSTRKHDRSCQPVTAERRCGVPDVTCSHRGRYHTDRQPATPRSTPPGAPLGLPCKRPAPGRNHTSTNSR